jgi:hypothetical protein
MAHRGFLIKYAARLSHAPSGWESVSDTLGGIAMAGLKRLTIF